MRRAENVRFPKTAEPTVLLIDRNPLKQQLRATVLRNCEIDVRTTDNLAEAQRLCRIQRYDMILLAADGDSDAALISSELWKVSPRQRISLFVGPPKYLKEGLVHSQAGRTSGTARFVWPRSFLHSHLTSEKAFASGFAKEWRQLGDLLRFVNHIPKSKSQAPGWRFSFPLQLFQGNADISVLCLQFVGYRFGRGRSFLIKAYRNALFQHFKI
jgi:hypothetical protein